MILIIIKMKFIQLKKNKKGNLDVNFKNPSGYWNWKAWMIMNDLTMELIKKEEESRKKGVKIRI